MHTAEEVKKQILVVEDEGLIAADIRRRLERLGYSVPAIARSGEEAIECARSTPFDLVLMDIRLKGDMDGIAAAQTLKSELETPVVYMTAHSDQDTLDRAKVTEPFGYILKPVGDGDLRSAVQISLYKAEMERRLRTSEAWLSTTLRSVGDAIVATNTDGEIVFLNAVAEELTGWSSNDAHGCLLMDVLGLFEESTRLPAKNPVFDLFAGENRIYTLVSKAGKRTPVEIGCFENRAGDEVWGAVLVVRDITARRDMEGRLMQSQRMEAIANLAGGLAHDFNNQLTVILGYADELCGRLSDAADKEAAHEIRQAASLAGSLTGQLLTLSRRDVARSEVLDLNDLICEMQPLLSHSLGRSRLLATDFGPARGFVRADRNQLKQVLLNLALNARDAMPSGGELRIGSSTVEIDGETPAARLYRPGVYVRLTVTDTGEGMSPETLARVFEPFFTTKEAGFGTGLGLAIVHSIIAQSGGYINANSEMRRGTSFEIMLPCVGTFRGLDGVTNETGADPVPTVLLVEDEDRVRRLMHGYLERGGYQLLEARNADEAELIAEVYREPIHVLVTDILMPGITGLQLAERLAPLRPAMKVLFVTGYRHDTLEHQGVFIGDANVLTKPFPGSELLKRVGMLVNRQTLLAR
ncbi:MAG: hybrid sensor histidine kinase/response regulator [Terriglobia bacterium]|nr:MAG: hybrid sensor histidine kinase/response regulator [Terriglobia bacterium]